MGQVCRSEQQSRYKSLNFPIGSITSIAISDNSEQVPGEYMERAPRISFTSLGCPKALVDSERIITRLRAEGYELARKHDRADIVIVNTCGFLDSAKQESLSAI